MIKAVIFDCFGVLVLPNVLGLYNKPNEPLLAFIAAELRPRFQTGIISNIASDHLEELMGKEARQLFDDAVLSFAEGVSKPDRRIYEIACERLGVVPEECVFIDDIREYCDAAEAVGMQAIEFVSTKQCLDDLRTLIGASN